MREEVVKPNQSLVEMGGTKKRKRESSLEDNSSNSPSTSIQTTVPNIDIVKKNGRKRKSGELNQDGSPNKIQKPKSQRNQEFSNKNKKNKGKNKQRNNQNSQNFYGARNQNRQTNRRQQNQISGNNLDIGESENQPNIDEENNSFHIDKTGVRNKNFGNGNRQKGGFKGKYRGKKRNPKMQGDNRQSNPERENQDFAPYDYTSVDFRQFQGGAEVVQKQRHFKSSFKFKVLYLFCCNIYFLNLYWLLQGKKRNHNKGNNNRSATFGGGGTKGR